MTYTPEIKMSADTLSHKLSLWFATHKDQPPAQFNPENGQCLTPRLAAAADKLDMAACCAPTWMQTNAYQRALPG
jgi:hypothetical protein